jgi:hypothetical protein
MATTIPTTPRDVGADSRFLRRVLALDAIATAASGLLLLVGGQLLGQALGLSPSITAPAAILLLPWAAFVGAMANRTPPPAVGVELIVLGNVAWAIASVAVVGVGVLSPNLPGLFYVMAQAGAVAVLAALQIVGLRRLG